MKVKNIFGAFLLTLAGSIMGVLIYTSFFASDSKIVYMQQSNGDVPMAKFAKQVDMNAVPNFVGAVDAARPAVVSISTVYGERQTNDYDFPFRFFEESPGSASGSGVIISPDGYIVTNNHVVEDADKVRIVLFDNRSFTARVVGTDLTTDLALLKIKASDLPSVPFGNSDNVKVGQWVLALGNPMNLTSTVTAGIVSAKGRNIELLSRDSEYPIESFIQTDAAVNPGNSGGALVNQRGELVGINTAIASRTGTYAGYSFAIPSAIVKKVTEDLLAYGEVQRGFLGVSVQSVNAELAKEMQINVLKGAYVTKVISGSGASDAGIREGDVITSINDSKITNTPELLEKVGRYRPGDKIKVNVIRERKNRTLTVTLKDKENAIISRKMANKHGKKEYALKGNSFRMLSSKERETLGVEMGVKVEKVGDKLDKVGIQKGFIITELNGRPIKSIEELEDELGKTKGMVKMKGKYDRDTNASYTFNW